MKSVFRVTAGVLIGFALFYAGAVLVFEVVNRQPWESLEYGMSTEEARETMGPPDSIIPWNTGEEWWYSTDQGVALRFSEGKLRELKDGKGVALRR